jgi:hypothetical protein
MDQPGLNQTAPPGETDKKTNWVVVIVIILAVLLICCLVACIAGFLLLAPTTGNVFSNIIEGIQTPIP